MSESTAQATQSSSSATTVGYGLRATMSLSSADSSLRSEATGDGSVIISSRRTPSGC